MNPVTWQKLLSQCVGIQDALVFLSVVKTLCSLQHAVCVGSLGVKARLLSSGRQPEGQAALVYSPYKLGQRT